MDIVSKNNGSQVRDTQSEYYRRPRHSASPVLDKMASTPEYKETGEKQSLVTVSIIVEIRVAINQGGNVERYHLIGRADYCKDECYRCPVCHARLVSVNSS